MPSTRPTTSSQVVTHLQAAAPYPTEAVVRIAAADPMLVKRYLDAGVRSLLVPFVEDVETARHVVAATRYPPHGFRGVSVSHRGNRFGRMKTYLQDAHDILLRGPPDRDQEVASTPSSTSPGRGRRRRLHRAVRPLGRSRPSGQRRPSEVQAVIEGAIGRCRDAGRPIGILAPVQADAKRYLELGATMVAVGSDLGLLVRAPPTALARGLRPAAARRPDADSPWPRSCVGRLTAAQPTSPTSWCAALRPRSRAASSSPGPGCRPSTRSWPRPGSAGPSCARRSRPCARRA